MGRRPQPEIRQRLLDACTDHVLLHGLPDRMAPIATAAGTSTRMLIYHFGGRDDLLRAVVAHARGRQLELFGSLLDADPDRPYTETLADAWAVLAGPEAQPYLRLFGPRHHDDDHLGPDFRRRATTDWLPHLERGLAGTGRPELATLVLAVIRGLLMDLDATGDHERTSRALDHFLAGIGPGIRDDAPRFY